MIKTKEIFMPFGKSGNIYLFGSIFQGLAPVFLTPFLTRKISISEFGQVTVLNSISVIIAVFLTFGIPIVISRSYVLEKNKKSYIDEFVNRLLFIYLVISFLLFGFFKFNDYTFILYFSIGFHFAIYQIGLPTLRARNSAGKFASYSFINTVLPFLFILMFQEFYSNIYDLFFLGSLVSSIFALIIVFKKSTKDVKFSFLINTIKTGLPILPHMLGMIALVNIDKVLFGYLKSEDLAGFLQIIMLIGLSPIFILSALNHAWLNQILLQLRQVNKSSINKINHTIQNLFILMGIAALILFFTKNVLIEILNPNISLTNNVSETIILSSMTSFLYIIYLANTHILTWSKRFWILGISTPLTVIIQVMVIYFSLERFNYLSASFAFGISLTTQVLILEVFNKINKLNKIINFKFKLTAFIVYWFFFVLFII